jgi:hypothetical protein
MGLVHTLHAKNSRIFFWWWRSRGTVEVVAEK